MMMPVNVLDARSEDANAIGRVHVRAWRAAYRGLVADAYLDALDERARAERWRELLETRMDRTKKFLIARRSADVVGFAFVGPDRDDLGVGEVYALYVDPDAWGTGVAQPLLAHATAALAALEHAEGVLWVLRGNARARRFYEKAGWLADGAEKLAEESANGVRVTFDEVRYRGIVTRPR